jgi:hypothetical protein
MPSRAASAVLVAAAASVCTFALATPARAEGAACARAHVASSLGAPPPAGWQGGPPSGDPPSDEQGTSALTVVGIVLQPVGGATASVGSFLFNVAMATSCDCAGPCDCGPETGGPVALVTGGALVMVTGIVLTVVGGNSRESDDAPSATAAPGLVADRSGFGWRF